MAIFMLFENKIAPASNSSVDLRPLSKTKCNSFKILFFMFSCIFVLQCRERSITYKGPMSVSVHWEIDGRPQPTVQEKQIGEVPIMVKVRGCLVRVRVSQRLT